MDNSISNKTLEENLHTIELFRTLSDPIAITEYAKKKLRLTFPFTTPKYIETSLYRVRPQKKIRNEDLARVSTFSYVPRELNNKGIPSMGRFNQDGQSIFYASLYVEKPLSFDPRGHVLLTPCGKISLTLSDKIKMTPVCLCFTGAFFVALDSVLAGG